MKAIPSLKRGHRKIIVTSVLFYLIGVILNLGGMSPALAISTPVESNFDTDLDGWTLVAGQFGTLTHSPVNGNPGGYAQFTDGVQTSAGHMEAPAKFLGDWSNLNGIGRLNWDHRIFEAGSVANQGTLRAFLRGPGGTNGATFDSGLLSSTQNWVSVVAPIEESSWTVTSGSWSELLQNVTAMRIVIETIGNAPGPTEVAGVDNVRLSEIPEPASFTMFLTGLAGLGLWRWKKNRAG